jgi:hypothetical protein
MCRKRQVRFCDVKKGDSLAQTRDKSDTSVGARLRKQTKNAEGVVKTPERVSRVGVFFKRASRAGSL